MASHKDGTGEQSGPGEVYVASGRRRAGAEVSSGVRVETVAIQALEGTEDWGRWGPVGTWELFVELLTLCVHCPSPDTVKQLHLCPALTTPHRSGGFHGNKQERFGTRGHRGQQIVGGRSG